VIVVMGVASIADVPNPRPNGWVSDQAHVLGDAGKQQLDGLAERLHADRGIELAVVTVDDVPGTPKQFATALFNRWGIGSAATNNGVLVLLVVGKRRLEIETGRGIEAALPAAWLADMQRDRMVPRFKAGDLRGGLVAGLEAIDEHVRAAPAESSSAAPHGEYRSDGSAVPPTAGSPISPGLAGAPGARPAAPASASAPTAPTTLTAAPADSQGGGGAARGLAGLGAAVFGLVGGGVLVSRMRRRQRTCFQCQPPQTMIALDERADDARLDAGQRTEEAVGSVDYEVLVCPGCQASRTFRHGRWLSSYDTCAGCSYKTSRSTSRTIIEATYDHGGEIEVTESCVHCHRKHCYTRTTSQLTRPSDSSSSSSSSSSASSSSSSSDSSGFSGGSSDGGGAGSSW
jgi:uncharacterized protein